MSIGTLRFHTGDETIGRDFNDIVRTASKKTPFGLSFVDLFTWRHRFALGEIAERIVHRRLLIGDDTNAFPRVRCFRRFRFDKMFEIDRW